MFRIVLGLGMGIGIFIVGTWTLLVVLTYILMPLLGVIGGLLGV